MSLFHTRQKHCQEKNAKCLNKRNSEIVLWASHSVSSLNWFGCTFNYSCNLENTGTDEVLGFFPSQHVSSLAFAETLQSERNSHYFSLLVNIVSHSRSLDLKAKGKECLLNFWDHTAWLLPCSRQASNEINTNSICEKLENLKYLLFLSTKHD